jgi:quercetin dioxygenase-like cupin family protein
MAGLVIRNWNVSDPNVRAAIAEAWEHQGYDCQLWIDEPGREWHNFVHPTDELVVLLEGDLEVEVAGQRARLKPGDEVLIPAGARHSVFNRGTTTARWLFGYKHKTAEM